MAEGRAGPGRAEILEKLGGPGRAAISKKYILYILYREL